jgi:hypothetical protein
MTTKFVVRLVDAEGRLLAWAPALAGPRPQPGRASCPFWPEAPTRFAIEQSGRATAISVHWCDLDIARTNALIEAADVEVGQVFNFTWIEPIWLVAGMRDVALPAVTERQSVEIGVPVGGLGMVGT